MNRSILAVTTCLGGGGAERHLVRISNSLGKEYAVHLAVLRPDGSYEALLAPEVGVTHVGPIWAHRSTNLSSRFSTSRLARLIDDLRPDCCISFLEPAAAATYHALSKSQHSCPHTVAIQNNPAQTFRALNGFRRRRLRVGAEAAILHADRLIAISEGVAAATRARWSQVSDRISTVYNAAFDDMQQAEESSQEPIAVKRHREFQLVACGRLTEQKGFCDLIEATQLLANKLDVGLWLLGTGPLEHELRRQVKSYLLDDRVAFLGFQSNPLAYFAKADLFVLSSWWEGFGNVVAEAMCVGTPVVATDCDYGPAEITADGKYGVLVPPKQPAKLAEAIESTLLNKDLRQWLSNESSARAQEFSADKIANEYSKIILAVPAHHGVAST